ncbi:MAG: alpha-2-macroglobulin [Planctomycetes bacterium]|nr:alpha-2-macroglobulin [Planctomycetota bacterium]
MLRLAALVLATFLQSPLAQEEQRAEAFYAQQSWELALESYRAIPLADLSAADRRRIEERILECDARSAASTDNPDPSRFEQAVKGLTEFQRKAERPEDKDEAWVRAEEALGDVYFLGRNRRDWGTAWPHYSSALDWWAGSGELERARTHYLSILFRVSWPDQDRWYGNWWQGQIPLIFVENAIRIAKSAEDRARAQFLFAIIARQQGSDYGVQQRALAFLREAVASGKQNRWHDDALFLLAQWLESPGVPEVDENGAWQVQPDFVQALALYQSLVKQYQRGESRYLDDAQRRIEWILDEDVGVAVPCAFLPGSEVGFQLSWRNLPKVGLALYAADLTQDVSFRQSSDSSGGFLTQFDTRGRQPVWSSEYDTHDAGAHLQGQAEIHIDPRPAPGAYVLEARRGSKSARELVLIGSTSLVAKASHEKLLLWATDAMTSAPLAGASVSVWVHSYRSSTWTWKHLLATTGEDGTALLALPENDGSQDWFASIREGERQAFVVGNGSSWRGPDQGWKLFAFTDRPAYRPGQRISWKLVARQKVEGRYQTPTGRKLGYRLLDPRGQEVEKGELALSAFGSVFGEFATKEAQALGEYQADFFDGAPDQGRHLGRATLFRLEEYKLPEFQVAVSLPGQDGKPRIFRVGDRVEANVEAHYYFGGVVSQASVEVIVRQQPYWRQWPVEREYPWYFEEPQRYWGGEGQIVSRQTLKTDAQGRALVVFDTPANGGQDFEYTIEARVTDASRREVAGSGRVRVTRTAYAVNARTEHNLFRLAGRADFVFSARDANDNPVEAEGKLALVRSRWHEIWVNPSGQRIDSDGQHRPSDFTGWKVIERGYLEEEIATAIVRTNARGEALWNPVLPKDGYYTARWTSRDDRKQQITAAVSLWCSDERSTELGYRSEGLEIVIDKDSARVGEKLPVMLSAPVSGRYVLLAVESEVLHSYQVVRLDGTIKLLTLPLAEEHVPNFYLSAWSYTDGNLLADTKEVVVPAVEQFLDVTVEPDSPTHMPGEQGTFTVHVVDHAGRPVAAELGFSVVDASVLAIQSEYNPDPRPFFFGEKRGQWIRTSAQQNWKDFARLKLNEQQLLFDARQAGARDESGAYRGPGDSPPPPGSARGGFAGRAMSKASAALEAGGKEKKDRSDFDAAESLNFIPPVGEQQPQAEIVVRSDFRETALWKPDLVTGADGTAQVTLKYPDSLTRWSARARAFGTDARMGTGTASVQTRKPLQARLQAPRFFVVGDTCTLSALIDNQGEGPLSVDVKLDASGIELLDAPAQVVTVAAGEHARVDWQVRVTHAGRAELVLSARSGSLSDAMKKSYPVEAHGIEALVAGSWKLGHGSLIASLDVPAARTKASTRFLVQVTPSLAVTMLDALPYLVQYPYGCTEQTMSRFLPTAIVAKTLRERGLSVDDALARVFGGIEETTPQKSGKHLAELEAITQQSLARLADFQHADGGWGWWKEGESDLYMSAYVVWGLSLARDGGIAIDPNALARGVEYLRTNLVEAEELGDLAAWMLHALSTHARESTDDVRVAKAFDRLWERKSGLNAYAKALFALAAHGFGRETEAKELLGNLANGAIIDESPEASVTVPGGGQKHALTTRSAHWGQDRIWSRWSDGGVETTAFVLRALVAIDPKNALVDPALTWLLKNRRAAQWSNTRDTAITVLALDAYLSASGELARDVEYAVLVNGKTIAQRKLSAADMLRAPSQFTLDPKDIVDGANAIEVRIVSGEGPLYVSARAEFFSLEEPIPARGSEIFVARQYFKLVAKPTLLKGFVYERVPLRDGDSVQSGERVEVVLTTEAKNDLEYLLFEDLKPAGLEAVEVKSGGGLDAREIKSSEVAYRFGKGTPSDAPRWDDPQRFTGRSRGLHAEWRDRKVALFADKLAQGVWELRYELRAEVPGTFHALPVLASAMYVPEIKGNSEEIRLTVAERRED